MSSSKVSYDLVTDTHQVAQAIADSRVLALDLETTGLDPLTCKIRLVSVTTDAGTWVIDLFKIAAVPVIQALRNYSGLVVGHNLKFDQKFLLHHFKIEFHRVFDTFRASYMLWNGHPTVTGHNLYDLQERELGWTPNRDHDLGGSDWSGTLTQEQLDYSAADTACLLAIYRKLVPRLKEAGLVEACKIEFGAILPEAVIELNGFRLDSDSWKKLALKNREEAIQKRIQLSLTMPHPSGQLAMFGDSCFNLDSTQQVIKSFRRLGIDLPDTDKTTLAQFGNHFLVREYMEYRKSQKKVTSFGEDYLSNIHPQTGRIHSSYWPLTGAGRYSSSNPNLQQLPRTKDFRGCFFPLGTEAGARLVLADYSQIELRLVAQVSGDPTLLRVYELGEDAHQRTGSIISGVPLHLVSKDARQQAKPINFGLMYGMGPETLVVYALTNYGVVLTLEQAKDFHRKFFKAYGAIQAWHRKVWAEGQRTRMSRTISGRLRYLDPEESYNEFKNTPIQGSGADGLKAAMPLVLGKLRNVNEGIKLVHMVHDELIAEVPRELTASLSKDARDSLYRLTGKAIEEGMVEGMARVQALGKFRQNVPVVAEASVCTSWADK